MVHSHGIPNLPAVRRAVCAHQAVTFSAIDRRRAAVAIILREQNAKLELLFIKRAQRIDDPWSGHLAFPGGRINAKDGNPRIAAERETWEEIGVELRPETLLGQLDDIDTMTTSMLVSAFVYEIKYTPSFILNNEVEQAFWYPVGQLADPKHHALRWFEHQGVTGSWASIDLKRPELPLLWGVTYRFVVHLLSIIGLDPPASVP